MRLSHPFSISFNWYRYRSKPPIIWSRFFIGFLPPILPKSGIKKPDAQEIFSRSVCIVIRTTKTKPKTKRTWSHMLPQCLALFFCASFVWAWSDWGRSKKTLAFVPPLLLFIHLFWRFFGFARLFYVRLLSLRAGRFFRKKTSFVFPASLWSFCFLYTGTGAHGDTWNGQTLDRIDDDKDIDIEARRIDGTIEKFTTLLDRYQTSKLPSTLTSTTTRARQRPRS